MPVKTLSKVVQSTMAGVWLRSIEGTASANTMAHTLSTVSSKRACCRCCSCSETGREGVIP